MDNIFEAMRAFNNGEEEYFRNCELLKKSRENVARKEGYKKGLSFKANIPKETITQVTGLTTEEIDKIILANKS